MLLQFYAENFLSIKDELCFNLIPVKSRLMNNHIISDKKGKQTEVLPISAIYGANGSGKTNLIKAMSFAQELIVQGTRSDDNIATVPFLLSNKAKDGSRFEFVFKHNGVVYTYGFVVSETTILEEWLFARYTAQESKLFERVTKNSKTQISSGVRLSKNAGGEKFLNFVAMGTRPNQLFLTEANEKNIEILKPVYNWFRENLQIIWPNSEYRPLGLLARNNNDFIDFLSKFLKLADTGIYGIEWENEPLNPEKHFDGMPDALKKHIDRDISSSKFDSMVIRTPNSIIELRKDKKTNKVKYLELKTIHQKEDGSFVKFKLSSESDGTRRIMDIVPMLMDGWGKERVFVIDELDRSLHTLLSKLFIKACLEGAKSKKSCSQFIVTTHDTNLLDRKLLRRDEIWFIEKDKQGASHLSNLAEYAVNDGLNYQNGYLNGRFGAIPFVGDLKELVGED